MERIEKLKMLGALLVLVKALCNFGSKKFWSEDFKVKPRRCSIHRSLNGISEAVPSERETAWMFPVSCLKWFKAHW